MRWLIDGFRLYRETGLFVTEESKSVLCQYQAENDYIRQFIDECLELGETYGRVRLSEVKRTYREWCTESGIHALGIKLFKEELEKHHVMLITVHKQDYISGRLRTD